MIDYFTNLFILIEITFILALSLQITIGFTGLFNMGHIGFYAIGAYSSALLVLSGLPFWFAILVSAIASMASGLLLSIPTKRMKKENFSWLSLTFGLAVYSIILNWTTLTGGPRGISGIPKPTLFGLSFSDNTYFLILVTAITLGSFVTIRQIVSSPFGRVLAAIRENELAASTLGKNAFKMKSFSLGFSGFFAGIAGSLYAHYITYISPSSFTFTSLIPAFLIIILGGLASLKGTVVATILVVLLPEFLSLINLPSSMVGPLQLLIFGLLLLLIVIYRPKGFFGKVDIPT